jgi:hypothetical protein
MTRERWIVACATALLITATAVAGDIQVMKLSGEVNVRQGVTEVWNRVAVGDVLRPDDSMKTGPKGSVTLSVRMAAGSVKRITLPPEVIVDLSDIRELTQEELMLKLTMEKVRASSYEWKEEKGAVPNTSVIHGANRGITAAGENDPAVGNMQLRGTRVLFENGFYSTCALRAMEIFRFYPALGQDFSNRLLVAEALEKASLRGESLNEYGAMLELKDLSPEQEALVRARMSALKKKG